MGKHSLILSTARCLRQDPYGRFARRFFSSTIRLLEDDASSIKSTSSSSSKSSASSSSSSSTAPSSIGSKSSSKHYSHTDWDITPGVKKLPYDTFGYNQYIKINEDLRGALKEVLWQFNAPIMYAIAYGSGVFPQSKPGSHKASGTTSSKTSVIHTNPAVLTAQDGNPKMIDFIFGVTHVDHWHSINLKQHRDHYSALGSLGCGAVTRVQENFGAGVYFNPYVTMNGMLIKYGVVSLDTLRQDLSEWNTMYVAGRLQKPVKILRQTADIQVANQINLISALRTALLLLPPTFNEMQLYGAIAGISYLGDPRMALPTEDPGKVANIVGNNLPHFRRLYGPLIADLPNVDFTDAACANPDWASDSSINASMAQDMDPVKRGNMVRRLPKAFRERLYFQFQKRFQIPQLEFDKMMSESRDEDAHGSFRKRQGGEFERRIASVPVQDLGQEVREVIKNTISWPSTVQSAKGLLTSGFAKTWRYVREKMEKHSAGKAKAAAAAAEKAGGGVKNRAVEETKSAKKSVEEKEE